MIKKCLFIVITWAIFLTISTPANCKEQLSIKTINIATPHWENQTNEDGTGLFFEIIRNVYEPVGIKMTFRFAPWKRAQSLVNKQHSDAMLCVWKEHADEENQMIPKHPMFIEHTAAIFKKDSIKSWKGIENLDGKTAVWLRGYDYHQFKQLKGIKFLRYHEVDSYDEAWQQLELGRFEIYIDALIDMDIYIKSKSIDMSHFAKEVLWGEKAYISFSKAEKNKELVKIYDEQIKKMFMRGELQKIYEKWDVKFFPEYWKD